MKWLSGWFYPTRYHGDQILGVDTWHQNEPILSEPAFQADLGHAQQIRAKKRWKSWLFKVQGLHCCLKKVRFMRYAYLLCQTWTAIKRRRCWAGVSRSFQAYQSKSWLWRCSDGQSAGHTLLWQGQGYDWAYAPLCLVKRHLKVPVLSGCRYMVKNSRVTGADNSISYGIQSALLPLPSLYR